MYFGGTGYYDSKGELADKDTFFAYDLQSHNIVWKFPLDQTGYGTYGTYPALIGNKLLVCARERLYCLDRSNGTVLWQILNWMGKDADSITVPYIYEDIIYYKIREAYFTKSKNNDGNWAMIALDSGQRISVIPVADEPGTYENADGQGLGIIDEGIIYGATRMNRFGALDLKIKRLLWEVSYGNRARPAINKDYVFTARNDSIDALDKNTGKVIWSEPVGSLTSSDHDKEQSENSRFRRFAATNDLIIVQGPRAISARETKTGKLLWLFKSEANINDADPLVKDDTVILSSASNSCILALNIKTGKEIWRITVPDCKYYMVINN